MELKYFRQENPFIWIYLNIGTYLDAKRVAFDLWLGFNKVTGFSIEKILREKVAIQGS